MEKTTKFYIAVAALFAMCVIANFHSMLKHTNQVEETLHRSKRAIEDDFINYVKETLHRSKREIEDDFINEALEAHNELRKKHGSPPLTVDKKLCAGADDWAKKIADDSDKADKITMTHSHLEGIGENMAVCKCKPWTGEKISHAWYDEIKLFNWTQNIFNYRAGHFTQLIWKETTTFCIARHTTDEYSSVVARYHPRGNENYHIDFAENVFPATT